MNYKKSLVKPLQVWGQPVIQFNFYPNKLLDYRGQEDALAANNNPFAWVTLVQLAAIGSRQDPDYRYQQKSALTRYLYRKNYSNEDIRALYTFIDWVMTLPEHLEIRYNEEIKQFEEEHHMRYITSIERQGIQQGVHQGEYALLHRLLRRKFQQVPQYYLDKMGQADSDALLKWGELVLDAKNLTDVFED